MTEEFASLLADTVAWCARHARADDAGTSTRSPTLCPPVMALSQRQRLSRLLNEAGEAQAAVHFVCQARRRELARLGIPVTPLGADFAGGRILYTTIDTDSCECATEPSNGYLDLDDLPGWDTWFWHRPTDRPWGAIYCWVPTQLVELADNGLRALPCNNVRWLQSLDELSNEPDAAIQPTRMRCLTLPCSSPREAAAELDRPAAGGRMNAEAAFLAAIQAAPANSMPRLVYADWLEERGDPRGEFLRVECALAARPTDEPHNAQFRARYLALWLSSDPEWLRTVDRLSARLLPSDAWEEYRRAQSYSRAGLEANMLCHLLVGLYGPARPADSLPAADLKAALAENRVLTISTSRDGFGGGSVWVSRTTPEDNRTSPRTPQGYVDFLVLPCAVTDEIIDVLRHNSWERSSESPLWAEGWQ